MMKNQLRALCKPLLNIFEKGEGAYVYKPMSRNILIVMGILFGGIAGLVITYIIRNEAFGYALPAIVFSGVAIVCLIVGTLGNERAVAKIWGNK